MKLFITSEDDYCVVKVLATASAVNLQLDVEKTTNEVLKELSPSGTEKSFALETSTGEILYKHIEILKFLASLCTTSNLRGSNNEDIEKVNYWLDLAWQQMEVPIQLLLALSSSDSKEFQMGSEEKSHVTISTKGDIATRLTIIENHLSSKTFFVGENITLADISLFVVCGMVSKLGKLFSIYLSICLCN
jgi:elongation factor 1-gamma